MYYGSLVVWVVIVRGGGWWLASSDVHMPALKLTATLTLLVLLIDCDAMRCGCIDLTQRGKAGCEEEVDEQEACLLAFVGNRVESTSKYLLIVGL